jgi:HlyD family secretion protein
VATAQATYDTLAAKEHDTNTTSLTTAQRQSALAAKAEAEAKLEQAEGKLLQAKTKLSEIKVKVEDGILRAPFDGKIAKLDISYGDQVLTSETPVTVMGDNIMEMDVYIPELDVAKVKVKDTANITIDAFNDDTVLLGTISQIDSVSSEIDGVPAYKATIILTDSDKRIRSGMSAHATVETNKKENVLGIPAQYIMRKNNETNVLLKIGNRKTKLQSVETGMRGTNNFVEVTNGLSENDVIVLPKK